MTDLPRLLSSDLAYKGRLFDLVVDEIEFGGGPVARREVVVHPGAVCMVPVGHDGRLHLVTQYRHPARRRLLELPAGTLEPGEEPLTTAIRELQEEIGMLPAETLPLGGFYVAPGYTTEYIHLFVCAGLSPSVLAGDDDEDIAVETLTLTEALLAIDQGRICDAKSIVGILRYAQSLGDA